jgi:tRNA-guanine transglycosylase
VLGVTYGYSCRVPSAPDAMPVAPDAPSPASPIHFEVLATDGRARATRLTFTAGDRKCLTPMFMPVGTQGSLKGLTSQQLVDLECQVVLGNTYHLANRPGTDVLESQGGLARFMNYKQGGTLTDSGGFQMVSLLDLADITEEGVMFQSPVDGKEMLLTPEKSMQIQNAIGADVIMALDDVVSSVSSDAARFEQATHRTLRWIDRCIEAHVNVKHQALFGIVQGGLDSRLRSICLEGLIKRDKDLPGYAIGGLAGGEEKAEFCKVVKQCCDALPQNKPRYVMGVGYPLDLVLCTGLGADMFDCVYPSRTARFGTALVDGGTIRLRTSVRLCFPNPNTVYHPSLSAVLVTFTGNCYNYIHHQCTLYCPRTTAVLTILQYTHTQDSRLTLFGYTHRSLKTTTGPFATRATAWCASSTRARRCTPRSRKNHKPRRC